MSTCVWLGGKALSKHGRESLDGDGAPWKEKHGTREKEAVTGIRG